MPRKKSSSPTLALRITDVDRDKAVQSNSGGCLIADAIKTQYPEYTGVTVDMATVRFTDRKAGLRYTYLTPPAAQHCLLSFDQGWPSPVDEVVLKRAVQVTNVIRVRAQTENRQARLDELTAKEAEGSMTRADKGALTVMRKHAARPSSYGPRHVEITQASNNPAPVIVGGHHLPMGPAHPNLLRGRNRHFGAKLADPGQAFREAVDKAVAERLTPTP